MKYVNEYRDSSVAKKIAFAIKNEANPSKIYSFMEFCGSHTHAIFRYGIQELLPTNVKMVHGPGCPVCVLPISRLDGAIHLLKSHNVTLCTYGDMMRVPGSKRYSLLKAKADGYDVRMVYSVMDALRIAKEEPKKEVVFFAIGFETTTPPTATAIMHAQKTQLDNFSVYCNHVLTPSAIGSILESPEVRKFGTVPLDGFIGPAHVSAIIGSQPYDYFAQEYQKPVVIAGFEPLDVMQAILMLIRQVNDGRSEVENEYSRAVTKMGNNNAKTMVANIFEMRKWFEWRGLGKVPYSGLKIHSQFSKFDTEKRFKIPEVEVEDNKACECGAILRGVKRPTDCKVFGNVCTPENPLGSCMVSAEGACAAYYTYGRFNERNK